MHTRRFQILRLGLLFIFLYCSLQIQAQDTLLFSEDFSSGSLYSTPVGWSGDWYIAEYTPLQSASAGKYIFSDAGWGYPIRITTPAIDCRNHQNIVLKFYDANLTYSGSQTSNNHRIVRVSNDSGVTWSNVRIDSGYFSGTRSNRIDVSAYAANHQYVMVQFVNDDVDQDFYWSIDDVKLLIPMPMQYMSSGVFINDTAGVTPGDTLVRIIGTKLIVNGSDSILDVSSITFSTSGTTTPANIVNAKLFVTYGPAPYSINSPVSSTVLSPNGSFTFVISPALPMSFDSVNFWLTYDLNPNSANAGDRIDATCTSITVGGIARIPESVSLPGSLYYSPERRIDSTTTSAASYNPVRHGSTNNAIIRIRVSSSSGKWFKLNNLYFSASSSNRVLDISKATLFYTGTSTLFDTLTPVGTYSSGSINQFAIAPNTVFKTNSDQVYFFLAYDIAADAIDLDTVKATFDSLNLFTYSSIPTVNGSTSRRIIAYYVSGTKTIGPGGDFTTFASAFSDLSIRWPGLGGVVYDVIGTDFVENPLSLLNIAISRPLIDIDHPVTFRKKPGETRNPKIIAPANTTGNMITIHGKSYVTFDGIDLDASAVTDNTVSGYYLLAFGSTQGAQHITIKNCSIMLTPGKSPYGIYQATSNPTSVAGTNSYNKFLNVTIGNCKTGIYSSTSSTSALDDSLEIGGVEGGSCKIGTADAPIGGADGSYYGIYLNNTLNAKIHHTEVQNLHGSVVGGSAWISGIYINSAFGKTNVFNNKVHNIVIDDTIGASNWVYGMILCNHEYYNTDPLTPTLLAYNNLVYDIKHRKQTPVANWQLVGVMTQSTYNGSYGTDKVLLYHNTICVDSSAGVNSMSLRKFSGTTILKNNILVNTCPANSITTRWIITEGGNIRIISDYNNFYLPTAENSFIGLHPFGGNLTTLANWISSFNNTIDLHSGAYNPSFISKNDLHINPNVSHFSFAGTPLSDVTLDLDGVTRSLSAPTMGAYEYTGTLYCSLALKAYIQGFINPGNSFMNMQDTILVKLHHPVAPYSVIDSITANISSNGDADLTLPNALVDSSYYISVRHRNTIETWSASPVTFTGKSISYNFSTAASQAYGNNLIQVGTLYCLYNGDVNADGFVDFSDLTAIDNDAYNFTSGYVVTDLNGDSFVDFTDLTICDNNAYNFIGELKPGAAKKSPKGIKQMTPTTPIQQIIE